MSPQHDEEAAIAARVGSTVDKYQLLRVLGRGGMGAVYEAQHRITGKRVALKMMHADLHRDGSTTERFLREARAASQIGHPSIVDVLDAGEVEGSGVYLVLELLDGLMLSDAVERRLLTLADILQVGVQVLEALAAAHANGIIHRDIKPENVFVTRDGRNRVRVKLLDFGLAKQVEAEPSFHSTQAGMILGTPYYMSPEQARGEVVDHRADLFSAGATMYFALSGVPPFEGQTYAQLMVRILTTDPAPLTERCPQLPLSIERWVEKALAKSADLRWQTAGEMADALRRAGADVSEGYLGVPPSVLPPPATHVSILEAIEGETRDLEMTMAATPLAQSQAEARASSARLSGASQQTKTSWVREARPVESPRRWWLWAGAALVLLGAAGGAVAFAVASTSDGVAPASPPPARAARPAPQLDLEERPRLPVPPAPPLGLLPPESAPAPAASTPSGTRSAGTRTDAGGARRATDDRERPATRTGGPRSPRRRSGDRLAPVTEYE